MEMFKEVYAKPLKEIRSKRIKNLEEKVERRYNLSTKEPIS